MSSTIELTEQQRKQNTFNKVWEHSLKMTTQSVSDDAEGCAYRSENHNCCFVGALIPDELYTPEIESKNAEAVIIDFPNIADALIENGSTTEVNFLTQLQTIHDTFFDTRHAELRIMADIFKLTVPE